MLPDFATLVESKAANVFVNVRRTNVGHASDPNLNSSSPTTWAAIREVLRGNWATEGDLKTSLEQIENAAHDRSFVDQFLYDGGFQLLCDVLAKHLQKEFVSKGLLLKWAGSVRSIIESGDRARFCGGECEPLLLALLSCVLVQVDDPMYVVDLAVSLFLALFGGYVVQTEDSLQLPAELAHRVNVPFEYVPVTWSRGEDKMILHHVDPADESLLKMAWNLAWHGGPEEAIGSTHSSDYSPKLQLTKEDQAVMQSSFPVSGLKLGVRRLGAADCHERFLKELQFLRTYQATPELGSELEPVLQPFLIKVPELSDDVRLFADILDFLVWSTSGNDPGSESEWTWLRGATANFRLFEMLGRKPGTIDYRLSELINAIYLAQLPGVRLDSLPRDSLSNGKDGFAALDTFTTALESAPIPDTEVSVMLEEITRHLGDIVQVDGYHESYRSRGLLRFLGTVAKTAAVRGASRTILAVTESAANDISRLLSAKSVPTISTSLLETLSQIIRLFNSVGAPLHLDNPNRLWSYTLQTFLDERLEFDLRSQAANVMINLVTVSDEADGDEQWVNGPSVLENISGVTVSGEAALHALLQQLDFVGFALQLFHPDKRSHPAVIGSLCMEAKTQELITAFLCIVPESLDQSLLISAILDSAVDLSESDLPPRFAASYVRSQLTATASCLANDEEERRSVLSGRMESLAMLISSSLHVLGQLAVTDDGGEAEAAEIKFLLCDLCSEIYAPGFLPDVHRRALLLGKYVVPLAKMALTNLEKVKNDLLTTPKSCLLIKSLHAAVLEEHRDRGSAEAIIELNTAKNNKASLSQRLSHEVISSLVGLESSGLCFGGDNLPAILHLNALASIFAVSFKAQDDALKSDLVALIQSQLDKVTDRVARKAPEATAEEMNFLESLILTLNNLCFRNNKAKTFVARRTTFLGQLHHLHPYIGAFERVQRSYLRLLSTLAIDCPAARNCFAVTQRSGLSKDMTRTCSILAFVLRLTKNAKLRLSTFRLLMVLGESSECRKLICRSDEVLGLCRRVLDLDFKRPTDDVAGLDILLLDLLLTLTSYMDAQISVGQSLMTDVLVPYAAGKLRRSADATRRRLALALLKNLCFASLNRPVLLQSEEFLGVVMAAVGDGGDAFPGGALDIAAVMLWALAANNSRAKQTLRRTGLTEAFARRASAAMRAPDTGEKAVELYRCTTLVLTSSISVQINSA